MANLELEKFAAIGKAAESFAFASCWNAGPERLPHHMPAVIPAAQAYYWTRVWQEGEARALRDIAEGRSQVFTDPRDLARYLLRPAD